MAEEKELEIGTMNVTEILPEEQWLEQQKLQRCDIVVKDGLIKKYPTKKVLGVQYYDNNEIKSWNKLQKEWKKAGGGSVVYENYAANAQARNREAIETNTETETAKVDIKNRTLYIVGGAILLVVLVIIKKKL